MKSTIAQIGALPRAVKVLILTNGFSAFGSGMIMPFIWVYLTEIRHFKPWVPASVLAVQAGAAVVGGLVWGVVLDRLPYRRAVPLANINAGVGTLVYAFASSPWVAIVAAVIFGFGLNGVGTTVRATYGAITKGDQQKTAYSADYGMLTFGMGLGVLVGGVIAAAGFASPTARYALLYTIDAVTFFIMAAATLGPLPGTAAAQEPEGKKRAHGYVAVLRQAEVVVVLALLLLTALVTFAQFRAGLPGYLLQSHAINSAGFSGAVALNLILSVVLQFAGMPLLTKLSPRTLVAASAASAGFCWIFVYLAGQQRGTTALVLACVGVALLSVAESLAGPMLSSQLNSVVSEQRRGRANALFSTTLSASAVIGPIIAGALLPWHQGVPLIICMVLLSAVALLLALFLASAKKTSATELSEDLSVAVPQ